MVRRGWGRGWGHRAQAKFSLQLISPVRGGQARGASLAGPQLQAHPAPCGLHGCLCGPWETSGEAAGALPSPRMGVPEWAPLPPLGGDALASGEGAHGGDCGLAGPRLLLPLVLSSPRLATSEAPDAMEEWDVPQMKKEVESLKYQLAFKREMSSKTIPE